MHSKQRSKKQITIYALLSAIITLSLIPFASSQQAPQFQTNFFCALTNTTTNLGACIGAAIPLSFLGILLSLLLVALAYMIGNVLSIEGLRNWYVNELKEAAKSILIITIVFSVLLIISSVALNVAVVPSSGSAAAQGIVANLQGMYTAIQQQYFAPEITIAQNEFYIFFGLDSGIGFLKSLALQLYLPIPIIPVYTIGTANFGFSESLYASSVIVSLRSGGSFLGNAFNIILLPTMFVLYTQQALLFYIIEIGLGVLLPIGIILRAIPFLRPLGGTFIALGIGAAIVYPSLLLMVNMPITSYIAPMNAGNPSALQPPCPQGLTNVECKALGFATSYTTNLFNNHGQFVLETEGFYEGIDSINTIYPAFNTVLSQSFINLALQFILFIFDLIAGVVITQDIAKVMGGKVSFGVGRLKLV